MHNQYWHKLQRYNDVQYQYLNSEILWLSLHITTHNVYNQCSVYTANQKSFKLKTNDKEIVIASDVHAYVHVCYIFSNMSK